MQNFSSVSTLARSKRIRAGAGATFAIAIAACKVSGVPTGPAAVIFAATGVAATAAYRQTTGGCWASCSAGRHCDEEDGLCKRDAQEGPKRLLREAQAREETVLAAGVECDGSEPDAGREAGTPSCARAGASEHAE